MPSPFPGMNPYLEDPKSWPSFHTRFNAACDRALAGQLAPDYFAQLEEHVYLYEMPEERWIGGRRPDIAIFPLGSASGFTGGATTIAPQEVRTPAYVDQVKLSYIAIYDRSGKSVVTVIELLSPSNKKPGVDRESYIGKRRELLASTTNLVEIDLHRSWSRMPWDGSPVCDYSVAVSRHWQSPRVGYWPVGLLDRLPLIPIPLKEGDREVSLDLQAVLDQVYDDAGYGNYLYATSVPNPPLTAEQAVWAEALILQSGRKA